MEERNDLKRGIMDDHILMELQMGGFRLIGQAAMAEVEGDGPWQFTLKEFGVLSIQRGQRPGALQGTVEEVKLVQLATLDMATLPIEKAHVSHYDFALKETWIDEQGRADMREIYVDFLNRIPSGVEHIRRQGEGLP